ncbi:19122_t:CDS:10, partial [Gigaspora margarita]
MGADVMEKEQESYLILLINKPKKKSQPSANISYSKSQAPKIQFDFHSDETIKEKITRKEHRKSVKNGDSETNVFETIIRYLGGLVSAFEFSKDHLFLEKAKELGTALLASFNSTTRLPYNNVYLNLGGLLSEVGTLCLEYTKLAQLIGNHEFFSMVNNITQVLYNANKSIQGLYPVKIDQETGEFVTEEVSFGANGDSFNEYLIKEYILVGGTLDQYKKMYIESIESMYKYLIKKSPVKERPDLLFFGEISDNNRFIGKMVHLLCFVPGMLAIGSKILDHPKDLEIAIRLAKTCYWSNRMTQVGIGAEEVWFKVLESKNTTNEENLDIYKRNLGLPDRIDRLNPSYSLLRPETIESLFILYRIMGDKKYQDKGWDIWQ